MSFYPQIRPSYLGTVPDGVGGIRATLSLMVRLVNIWKKDPGIRELALNLTRGLPQSDISAEVRALHAFVRDHIRYVNDIEGVETLQTPRATLELQAGDCDDKSVLLASLLASLGRKTRFMAVALAPSTDYSHVLPQVRIGSRWYSLETIRDVPAGWEPSNISKAMYAHV